MNDTPFSLPERPPARHLRGDARKNAARTMPMRGFDATYTDIVDYIVGITDEIWHDLAVGRIYDTYDAACTVYSSYGVVRSAEAVVESTIASLNAFPDGQTDHLAVAWSGDEDRGFYTSHLGFAQSTNLGRSTWGPATGKRSARYFVADCISFENKIHTEWLVRDNGVSVRQLGLNLQYLARQIGETTDYAHFGRAPTLPASRHTLGAAGPMADWACGFIDSLWNDKRFDRVAQFYADDAVIHAGGGREATGHRTIQSLVIHVLTALPGAMARVHHVCLAEEGDGTILAIRWTLEGNSAPGGVMGECPAGKPVTMMASSHLRFLGGKIVEEWMIFDELGMVAQTYRP